MIAPAKLGLPKLAADDYFARPEWSQSAIKTFDDRRRICHAQYVTRTLQGDNAEALDKGHVTHAGILEPHRVNEIYRIIPDELLSGDNKSISSKAAKDWCIARRAEGVIPLKQKAFDGVMAMVNAVLASDIADWLSTPCYREQSLFWTDKETKLPCKLRADIIFDRPDEMLCVDFKSGQDASPEAFRNQVERCGYVFQDRHYCAGIADVFGKPCRMYFVAVEEPWPNAVAVHELDLETVELGEDKYRDTLRKIRECVDSGDWSEPWEKKINKINVRPWKL
jgi:hypothetical protein